MLEPVLIEQHDRLVWILADAVPGLNDPPDPEASNPWVSRLPHFICAKA